MTETPTANSTTNQLIQNLNNPRDTDNDEQMEDATNMMRARGGFIYTSEMLTDSQGGFHQPSQGI